MPIMPLQACVIIRPDLVATLGFILSGSLFWSGLRGEGLKRRSWTQIYSNTVSVVAQVLCLSQPQIALLGLGSKPCLMQLPQDGIKVV